MKIKLSLWILDPGKVGDDLYSKREPEHVCKIVKAALKDGGYILTAIEAEAEI